MYLGQYNTRRVITHVTLKFKVIICIFMLTLLPQFVQVLTNLGKNHTKKCPFFRPRFLHSHQMRRYWFYLKNHFQNYRIVSSYVILYRSIKSKDKFINQSYPTKIVWIRAFFVFLKFFLWKRQKLHFIKLVNHA